MYNKTLGEERDIAREVAQAQGVLFADVITPMIDAMTKAKAKYGKDYHLAGGDGFHPSQTATWSWPTPFSRPRLRRQPGPDQRRPGCRQGRGRRRSQSSRPSTRESGRTRKHPLSLLLRGRSGQPGATRGVIEFFPFNADLNRLTLKVAGVGAAGPKSPGVRQASSSRPSNSPRESIWPPSFWTIPFANRSARSRLRSATSKSWKRRWSSN